jgi:hypothetical protein
MGSLQVAYRRRAVDAHPDRGGSHEAFLELWTAKEAVERVLAVGLPSPHPLRPPRVRARMSRGVLTDAAH